MRTANLTQNYPTLAVYGFSKTNCGSFCLPIDLSQAGTPGNHLYVSADTQALFSLSSDASFGHFVFPSLTGGPIVRVTGVFN